MGRLSTSLLAALFLLALGRSGHAQFTIGIDPPGFVPGSGAGVGSSTFGYGAYGPRGYGYYTPLPDIGYDNSGGGPSPYYSPIFNAMAAAPRDRTDSTNPRFGGGPVSASPPPRGTPSSPPRQSFLRRLLRPR